MQYIKILEKSTTADCPNSGKTIYWNPVYRRIFASQKFVYSLHPREDIAVSYSETVLSDDDMGRHISYSLSYGRTPPPWLEIMNKIVSKTSLSCCVATLINLINVIIYACIVLYTIPCIPYVTVPYAVPSHNFSVTVIGNRKRKNFCSNVFLYSNHKTSVI